MSIAIASLILLVVFVVIAVPVSVRALGIASRRNENRPEGGGETGSAQGQPSDKEIHDEAQAIRRLGPFLGALVALSGVPLSLIGAILATGVVGAASFTDTVPSTTLGAFQGLIGYFLGARSIGKATMIFAMVALMFGLLASQGYVPGLEATDHGLPANKP